MASTITHTETMAAADAIYEAAALFQGGGDAIVPESDVAQIVAQKASATKAAAARTAEVLAVAKAERAVVEKAMRAARAAEKAAAAADAAAAKAAKAAEDEADGAAFPGTRAAKRTAMRRMVVVANEEEEELEQHMSQLTKRRRHARREAVPAKDVAIFYGALAALTSSEDGAVAPAEDGLVAVAPIRPSRGHCDMPHCPHPTKTTYMKCGYWRWCNVKGMRNVVMRKACEEHVPPIKMLCEACKNYATRYKKRATKAFRIRPAPL